MIIRRRVSSLYIGPYWYHIYGFFEENRPTAPVSCEVVFGTPDGVTTQDFRLYSDAKESAVEFIDNVPESLLEIRVAPKSRPVITYTPYCRTCRKSETFTDPDAAGKFLLNHADHNTILEIK